MSLEPPRAPRTNMCTANAKHFYYHSSMGHKIDHEQTCSEFLDCSDIYLHICWELLVTLFWRLLSSSSYFGSISLTIKESLWIPLFHWNACNTQNGSFRDAIQFWIDLGMSMPIYLGIRLPMYGRCAVNVLLVTKSKLSSSNLTQIALYCPVLYSVCLWKSIIKLLLNRGHISLKIRRI